MLIDRTAHEETSILLCSYTDEGRWRGAKWNSVSAVGSGVAAVDRAVYF